MWIATTELATSFKFVFGDQIAGWCGFTPIEQVHAWHQFGETVIDSSACCHALTVIELGFPEQIEAGEEIPISELLAIGHARSRFALRFKMDI